ncbi:MAG TPA: hypothetical protein VK823_11460 [Streptosporangiaceae bacterium]|jgi:hypothetical protein|nr:hypothetical protein [Streptosporangiaceae bacterium]
MTKSPMTKSPMKWLADVAEHDFEAAHNYLSLKLDDKRADDCVQRMRKAKLTQRRANDILRATGLTPLPLSDPGVKRDLVKLLTGEKLSPILVCDQADGADIADGYHRVSLAYNIDPFMTVPLKIG